MKTHDENSQVLMLIQDIKDCFLAYISDKEIREQLLIEIGVKFNISKNDVIN